MDLFQDLSPEALAPILLKRDTVNPLEWLASNPFEYEKNYKYLHERFKSLYRDSAEMAMCDSVRHLDTSYCIEKIFVWNPTYDKRQHVDLYDMFGKDSRVQYITGPYKKAILEAEPCVIYDWSLDRIKELNEFEEFNEIFFGISNYRFNFDDNEKLFLKYSYYKRKNVAYFEALKYTKNSFLKG